MLLLHYHGIAGRIGGLTTLIFSGLSHLVLSRAKIVYSERKAGSAIISANSCLIHKQKRKESIYSEEIIQISVVKQPCFKPSIWLYWISIE